MSYQVIISASALTTLRKLKGEIKGRLNEAILALGENPRPHGVEKIKGGSELYRIRIGDFRVLYQIQDKVLVVVVIRVGHRREVYRGL